MSEQASPDERLLTFEVRRSDGESVVFELRGELDLDSAGELGREVELSFADGDPRPLVIDLGELSFMDSTGLALLVRTRNRAIEVGRDLRLRGVHGQVQRLFELASVTSAFTFVEE